MKITPLMTEKSLEDAKNGFYTFKVEKGLNKFQIKEIINEAFKVHVKAVRTITIKGGKRKNFRGRVVSIKDVKKALVRLGKDEKIDLFLESTKKK